MEKGLKQKGLIKQFVKNTLYLKKIFNTDIFMQLFCGPHRPYSQ